MSRRRGTAALAGIVATIALAASGGVASAVAPIDFSTFPCATSSPQGDYGGVKICSGTLPSWDGTPLDVDLTLPEQNTGATHPLIVMLHGFGGNKHNWESVRDEGDNADKWHWNNHWFAKHGYFVLTYTARGHCEDPAQCGPHGDEPPTPWTSSAEGPRGTAHLKSREFEIRDTQWLAALVADSFPQIDQNRIAVSGGSYGGGESWLQASQPDWTFPYEQTKNDPDQNSLPPLQLQVAIPKYPWTDLAYSLAPNGHGGGPSGDDIYESSQGTPDSDPRDVSFGTPKANPFGVGKASFVEGLFGSGLAGRVRFEQGEAPGSPDQGECAYNTTAWHNRAAAGDPYDATLPPPPPPCLPAGSPPAFGGGPVPDDDVYRQIRRGLTKLRSAYYQDEGWFAQCGPGFTGQQGQNCDPRAHKAAVFSIQGWTDDLFPAVESFRMFKYLKRLDPLWPVAVGVADVGHQRAQNKSDTWHRLNDQAWNFLQEQIPGSHREQTTVYSEPTLCPGEPNFTAAQQVTAQTPEQLSNGTLTVNYARPGETVSPAGAANPEGAATDPILAGNNCTEEPPPEPPPADAVEYSATSNPLSNQNIYVGLGFVRVHYELAGADTATLLAKVWDVFPDSHELLMTRGVYRIFRQAGYDDTPELKLPLFGNHWQLAPGHKIRLELTQVDQPFARPSNEPSSIKFDGPSLVLPTRDSGDVVLTGG